MTLSHRSRAGAALAAAAALVAGAGTASAQNSIPGDTNPGTTVVAGSAVATITVDAAGRYQASFVVEVPEEPLPVVGQETGIDLGLSHFAVLSDGTKVDAPRFARTAAAKLRRAQEELTRRQKGSANREKSRRKVARAVTDSDVGTDAVRADRAAKPGVTNLLEVLAACGGSPAGITTYGALKAAVTDAVVAVLEPVQRRYAELAADPAYVSEVYDRGAETCRTVTKPVLAAAREYATTAMLGAAP